MRQLEMQSTQEEKEVWGTGISPHKGPEVGERTACSRTRKHSRTDGEQQESRPKSRSQAYPSVWWLCSQPHILLYVVLLTAPSSDFRCEFASVPNS